MKKIEYCFLKFCHYDPKMRILLFICFFKCQYLGLKVAYHTKIIVGSQMSKISFKKDLVIFKHELTIQNLDLFYILFNYLTVVDSFKLY